MGILNCYRENEWRFATGCLTLATGTTSLLIAFFVSLWVGLDFLSSVLMALGLGISVFFSTGVTMAWLRRQSLHQQRPTDKSANG